MRQISETATALLKRLMQEYTAQANRLQHLFPDHPEKPVGEVSWEDLPATAATKRKLAFEEEMAAAWAAKSAAQAAKRAARRLQVACTDLSQHSSFACKCVRTGMQGHALMQGAASESSEELGAVDFMDEDSGAAHRVRA